MKPISMYRNSDASQGGGDASNGGTTNGTETKTEYVAKSDFDKLHASFAEFTDLVTKNFTGAPPMRDNSNNTAPANSNPSPVNNNSDGDISVEEAAEYGFEPKQVKFLNSLVTQRASKIAEATTSSQLNNASKADWAVKKASELDDLAYSKWPDLKNKQSEMYQIADEIMREHSRYDPEYRKKPDAVLSVAIRAEEELKRRKNNNTTVPNPLPKRYETFSIEVGSKSGGVEHRKNDTNISPERQQLRGLLRNS